MKLRNLTGAIRRTNGAVLLSIPATDGRMVEVGLVKSMFIAGLKDAFGDDAQAETGMEVDEDGRLTLQCTIPNGGAITGYIEPIDIAAILGDGSTIDIEDLLSDPTPVAIIDVEDLLA